MEKQTFLKNAIKFLQNNLLGEDQKAVEVLRKFGITSRDALEAFKVGYGCGNIKDAVPPAQQYYLEEYGLLTVSGERFRSSLTMPLYNLKGEIVCIVGRSFSRSHLYRTTKEVGVGNWDVLEKTDDVIASDNFLTVLKLYQEGAKNVVYVPDVDGFSLFKTKTITIISPAHSDELARHAVADHVYYSNLGLKSDSIINAIERRVLFEKEPSKKMSFPPKMSDRLQKDGVNSDIEIVDKDEDRTDVVPEVTTEDQSIKVAPEVEDKTEIVSEFEKREGALLDNLVLDLNLMGYAGEEKNKKLAYLVAISRKAERPLSAIIVSNTYSSNTHLIKAIVELTPPEELFIISNQHPNSIYHESERNLKGKCIIFDRHQSRFSGTISEVKKKYKRDFSLPSGYAYLESTIGDYLDDHITAQCLTMQFNESQEATQNILDIQKSLRDPHKKNRKKQCLEWHHEFQRNLESLPVYIPYIDEIKFPNHRIAFRYEQEKFLNLLEASAFVHQNEREKKEGMIYATEDDYNIAYDLFMPTFQSSYSNLSSRAQALLSHANEVESFSIQEVLQHTGWSYGSAYRTIKELVKKEYLSSNHKKKGHDLKVYTLTDSKSSMNYESSILKPEEIFSKHAG